jgi:hypothetical protein
LAAATAVAFEQLFAPVFTKSTKCPHGVHIRDYCSVCTQGGPQNTRPGIVLPRSSADPLTGRAIRANVNSENQCPACHSHVHIELSEKMHECADCGEKYPAPKRRKH